MSETSTKTEWVVRRVASKLTPGTRFEFSDELGGEGEVVTVVSATKLFGTVSVETEELDFTLELTASTFVSTVWDAPTND